MTARRPGPEETKRALLLAAAAWVELGGLRQTYEAAVLRQDLDEVEKLRQRAHDLLDALLDHHDDAAVAVRNKLLG